MSPQQQSIWGILRIAGPLSMFLIVAALCVFVLNIPLVLSITLACLFAVIEFGIINWLMRRKGGGA